jgi:hypothetical protein
MEFVHTYYKDMLKRILQKFTFQFFQGVFYFYGLLKFIRISGNLNQKIILDNGKRVNSAWGETAPRPRGSDWTSGKNAWAGPC